MGWLHSLLGPAFQKGCNAGCRPGELRVALPRQALGVSDSSHVSSPIQEVCNQSSQPRTILCESLEMNGPFDAPRIPHPPHKTIVSSLVFSCHHLPLPLAVNMHPAGPLTVHSANQITLQKLSDSCLHSSMVRLPKAVATLGNIGPKCVKVVYACN